MGEVTQLRLLLRTARALRQDGRNLYAGRAVARCGAALDERSCPSFIDFAIAIMTEAFDEAYSIDMLLRTIR
jgi:hypothetical protein